MTFKELALRTAYAQDQLPLTPCFLSRIIFMRLRAANVKVVPGVLLFVASLAESPGDAVMWAWELFNMPTKTDVIAMNDFIRHFGNNVPDHASYAKAWDDQKSKDALLSNLLDEQSIWTR